MTTIWVIEQGSYFDYRVCGVYSTRENAQRMCEQINKGSYVEATVREWPLDPGIEHLNAGRNLYLVCMRRDGTVERCEREDIWGDFELANWVYLWERSKLPAFRGKNVEDVLHGYFWAEDETHAIKSANELRAQWIETNKWE